MMPAVVDLSFHLRRMLALGENHVVGPVPGDNSGELDNPEFVLRIKIFHLNGGAEILIVPGWGSSWKKEENVPQENQTKWGENCAKLSIQMCRNLV